MARSSNLERILVNSQIETAGSFDNTTSGLTSTSVKGAIDEISNIKLDNTYVKVNSTGTNSLALFNETIAIGSGTVSNGEAGIAIGQNASTGPENYNIALGFSASTEGGEGGSSESIAIGKEAKVEGGVTKAVQLGSGTNIYGSTLQFLGSRIADELGLYTDYSPINYTSTNNGNVSSHFEGIDTLLGTLTTASHNAVTLDSQAETTQEVLSLNDQVLTVNLATPTTDGAFAATDKSKLDNIEIGATADQTGSEIKSLYEGEADTNAFTDAEKSKLLNIEENATGDQTGAEIKSLYEAEDNTNAFTDLEKSKLSSIEQNATADQIASEVPVSLTATNYTANAPTVEAHLVGLHSEIGSLQTALVGGVTYVGGYNANTNTPDLEAPSTGEVLQGDMYTVTADGDFFTAAVTIGDVIIAETDDPSSVDDWTIVENNIEDAADVAYNNTTSGLTATNVQTAIDEVFTEAYTGGNLLISGGGSPGSGNTVSLGFAHLNETTADYSFVLNQSDTHFLELRNGSTPVLTVNQFNGLEIPELASISPSNYNVVANRSLSSHFSGIDVELGNLKSALDVQPKTVNEETIIANKTLAASDPIFQHIISNTDSLGVALPSSPVNGTRFIIKNDESSTEPFDVTGGGVPVEVPPGEIYEAVYGTTKWMVI